MLAGLLVATIAVLDGDFSVDACLESAESLVPFLP